ncbi:thiamine transporter 2-like, partial [Melanaphis sacchari]|uniref:thiamine transporter 2-like n=1 Tax=Melanaphis sacchari TaxID=742174 RepID=UPI000DC13E2F
MKSVATSIEYLKTYGSLLTALLMFITADYFLYKPNIIFLTVCPCVFYFLMTCKPSVTQLRVSAFGVGSIHSADRIAFCYLFAKIKNVEQYQIAISIVTTAKQLGIVLGDISAQIIVNVTGGVYTILPYCNIFSLLLALIWACSFPSVDQKNDWHKSKGPNENSSLLKNNLENNTKNDEQNLNTIVIEKVNKKMEFFSKDAWINFKSSYSNLIVLKKSSWYILGMGAYIMVFNNINILYSYVNEKSGNHDVLSNGLA